MSLYLAGTFADKSGAILAINQLKTDGFHAADLTVFSDEPVELPRGVLDRPSHMSLVVVLGAIAFFLMVVAFVYYTQYDYRLVTGGMPIFSFWPTGVVFYEITMFGRRFLPPRVGSSGRAACCAAIKASLFPLSSRK